MATKTADKKAGDNAVLALSSFKYDRETGLLVRGQVFHLKGHVNDPLLEGMDYVRPVKKGTVLLECGECGATFLDESARERHGKHFHDQWCDCGWTPPIHVVDKDQAMRDHMKQCDVWQRERAVAAQRHLDTALASA
jgi:hypothetical protein